MKEKKFSNARWHEALDGDILDEEISPITDEELKESTRIFRNALLERGVNKEKLDKQLPID